MISRRIDREMIEGLAEDRCNRVIVEALRGKEDGMLTLKKVVSITNRYSYDSIRKHALYLSEAEIIAYNVQREDGTQRVYMRLENNDATKHFLRTAENYTE